MPFLAPTLDNANPIFAKVIKLGFYLHHIEVANQDAASVSLYGDHNNKMIILRVGI